MKTYSVTVFFNDKSTANSIVDAEKPGEAIDKAITQLSGLGKEVIIVTATDKNGKWV